MNGGMGIGVKSALLLSAALLALLNLLGIGRTRPGSARAGGEGERRVTEDEPALFVG
jgi:hypothetical protein